MCRRVSVNGTSRYHPNNFGCNAQSAFASSTKVRRQSLNHLVGARRYSSAAVNASNRVQRAISSPRTLGRVMSRNDARNAHHKRGIHPSTY